MSHRSAVAEDVEQKRLRSGITVGVGSSDLRHHLRSLDKTLPQSFREAHRVVSRDIINRKFTDQWIALVPVDVDDVSQLTAGRLIAHDPVRETVEAEAEAFRQQVPQARIYVYFAGEYPVPANIVYG